LSVEGKAAKAMSRKVLLIGHCGADASYLRIAVRAAVPEAQVLAADEPAEVQKAVADGVDLVLVNRELGYGFESDSGVELIASLHATHPELKMILVSNYADAQAAAVAAGALPGFGKRELGSKRVVELLRGSAQA
jgi:two-component system chemotaxis response regulator CheY